MKKRGINPRDPCSPHNQELKRDLNLTDEELNEWVNHKEDYVRNRKKECELCGVTFKVSSLTNFLIQWNKQRCICEKCTVLRHRREFDEIGEDIVQ